MRKWKQRLFSLLLCGAMLASLCPTALAGGGNEADVPYLDENGDEQSCERTVTVSATETAWDEAGSSSGWYVALNSVKIQDRVTVTGEVHLILANGCTLNAQRGINVSQGSSLTIYAQSTDGSVMGKLTATGSGYDAGIGGGYEDGGEITINGGAVTAIGAAGAGIGSGDHSAGDKITINGGTVTATGGGGAGIGSGANGAGGSTIIINGGTVKATSTNGAGIGGGPSVDGGQITISGGDHGAGGEITINGGIVDTTSLSGAGIGSGASVDGGQITISGGTVTAISRDGAGIGVGLEGAGGTITISGNAEVTATNTYNGPRVDGGAGIGGGSGGDGGEITIIGNAKVTATSQGNGAGIGGGSEAQGGTITITGGIVTALGGSNDSGKGGSGIGGLGDSKVTVNGGTVKAQGGSGGPGIGSLDPSNDTFGAGGSAFIMASSISVQDGKDQWSGVIFVGDDGKLYNSPVTLATDAEIPAGKTLVIEEGETLIIDKGVTLTNYGIITGGGTIKGTIVNHGTITDGITVQDHIHQWDTAQWSSDATHHWHKCTVMGCGERSGYNAHTPGDWIVDQAATSSTAGSRHKECTACGYTTQTETIPATGGGGSGGGGGYTPPTYKPDVTQPGEGGTVSVTPSRPERGDTVTVTPKPDQGYEVDKITVTDKDGKPVEVTKKPDGTYTFKQPTGRVKIEVSYKQLETPWNNPFSDVSEGDWYYEAVRFVQERGLMNGYSSGIFAPNVQLSRAQLAQILFNKEGRPDVNGSPDFSDVASEAWYTEAIRWAASQRIVGGYGNGTFGPNDPITREQLAVMLWRYSGSPAATNKELHFSDEAEIGGFALDAIRWAVENGILNGYGDGRLGPQGQATRAQVAQMLKNFIENQEETT